MITPSDIKDLVIGIAGDTTGGVLSALLLASKVAQRFQPKPQKVALQEALEDALREACSLFPETQKSVTKYYLEQLARFLKDQIVTAELAKLLDPQPATLLEKKLLREKFTKITQGYPPEQIPDLDFDRFIETLVYTFYTSAKSKPALQQVIQIQRLEEVVSHFIKLLKHTAAIQEATEAAAENTAAIATTLYQIAQDTAAIRKQIEQGLHGIEQLPIRYDTQIRNFLLYYLGTDKEPVPFGGREAEFRKLEAWRKQSDKPFMLLAAPAGRGKSALLVRWSQALLKQPDVAVVFVPVSARYGTNLEEVTFACLAARLAHLLGRKVPRDYALLTPQILRGLVADYLRQPPPDGRQLLVILDGLDEASWEIDASIFPLELPENTRILVSARYLAGETVGPEGWLRRLGWDRFNVVQSESLEPLTEQGVSNVLVKMGVPLDKLGHNVNIVAELHQLSEGDPLLVELYVKELWQKGDVVVSLHPEDLASITPGYEGFFAHWWDDQERLWGKDSPLNKTHVETILHVLAMAEGPLTIEDLQELFKVDGKSVTGMGIRQAIRPLARFLVGDGQQQGYIFAHPKLAYYFRDEYLSQADRQRWQQLFVTWGQQVLQERQTGQRTADHVSRYLLQYYSQHLDQVCAPIDSYLLLLSREWMESWHRFSGTYAGFLRDVDRVWSVAHELNRAAVAQDQLAPYLGTEIRCMLYHSSIRSLAQNLSGQLLVQLVKHNIWSAEQALVYARQHPNAEQNIRIILDLLPVLVIHLQQAALKQALQAAQSIQAEWRRVEVLSTLAPHLPAEVLQAAQLIQAEWSRVEVLSTLAPHLPAEVLQAAQLIQDKGSWAAVLSTLAPHLPTDQQATVLQDALQAAQSIQAEWRRAEVLCILAPHLPTDQQATVLQDALQAAQSIRDEGRRAEVLSTLAPHLPAEVLQAAQSIRDEWGRATVLSTLAPHLPTDQQATILQVALQAAQSIRDEWSRATVLSILGSHLPTDQQATVLQDILQAALSIRDEWIRATVLSTLAPHLPTDQQATVLQNTLQAAQLIQDEWIRAAVLSTLAPHLPTDQQATVLQDALQAAQSIQDEWGRAAVLSILAPYLPAEVLRAAQSIQAEWSRTEVLRNLAPHLPTDQQATVLQAALQAAQSIQDEGSRAEVLRTLAPYLPADQQATVLQVALQAAQSIQTEGRRAAVLSTLAPHLPAEVLQAAQLIQDKWSRAEVLCILAPHLPADQQATVLQDALHATQSIQDEGRRAEVLSTLASHLPTEVLQAAQLIQAEWIRGEVLSTLASYLPAEVLQAAQSIRDEWSRAEVLSTLAPHLPSDQQATVLQVALQATQSIQDEGSRAAVLSILASYLPAEVLQAAQSIRDEWSRAEVLSTLAPHLPAEVLQAAQSIRSEWKRAEVLSTLAPHLPADQQATVLQVAFHATQSIRDEWSRAAVLSILAPYLPAGVLQAAQSIQDEGSRAAVLSTLAPYLPAEVLQAVQSIQDEGSRAAVLSTLAPHLPAEVLQAAQSIQDEGNRAVVFKRVNEILITFPAAYVYRQWRKISLSSGNRARTAALSDLESLTDIVWKLGGKRALQEMLQALEDVGAWWP